MNILLRFYKPISTIYLLILLTGCSESHINILFDESITTIKIRSTLSLTPPRNLPELAIVDPDNTWFYLQGASLNKTSYPQERFIHLDKITIRPAELSAIHWLDGKEHFSQVFTKEGIYTIYLSDNLETEPENATTFVKKVRMVH